MGVLSAQRAPRLLSRKPRRKQSWLLGKLFQAELHFLGSNKLLDSEQRISIRASPPSKLVTSTHQALDASVASWAQWMRSPAWAPRAEHDQGKPGGPWVEGNIYGTPITLGVKNREIPVDVPLNQSIS